MIVRDTWGQKRIKGQVYDLSHLDSFILPVTPKGPGSPTFSVAVYFGPHAFTRKITEADTPDLWIEHNGESRCFCPVRYAHSLKCREMIEWAANGKVNFSHDNNFLIVRRFPEMQGPYAVAFNMVRAKRKDVHVLMFVVSAHERDLQLPRMGTISFATLVAKTARGEVITKP